MYLALQVMGPQAAAMGPNSNKVFSQAGGTIGRVAGNDWVLQDADRFISSRHAIVRCMGGIFSLEDVSTNGTFINGEASSIGSRNEPVMLKNGDRLQIGDYEVYVTVVEGEGDVQASHPLSVPGFDPALTSPTGYPPSPATSPTYPSTYSDPGSQAIGPVDPLELLGQPPPPPPAAPGAQSNHSSAMSDHFSPPSQPGWKTDTAAGGIPDDWDLTDFGASPSAAIPPTPPRANIPAPMPVQPGMIPRPAPMPAIPGGEGNFGDLMPLIVQGMMDVLKSRADIKSQFRMALTTIKPIENNPLKFSPTAADAIEHLFNNQRAGYLGPTEAFEEGFKDIKAHQLAMIAGMRAAFEHMLEQFSPETLEEHFEGSGKRGGLMAMANKVRYWDMYRDMFKKMTRDSDDNFRRLFGEEFATAYEEQMQKISRK